MELSCSPTDIEEDGFRRLKESDDNVLDVLKFDDRDRRDNDSRSECCFLIGCIKGGGGRMEWPLFTTNLSWWWWHVRYIP